MRTNTLIAALVASLASTISAHSWIEQLMVIDSKGSFTGSPGYPRNNILRKSPGFSDPQMVHILPTDGQPSLEQRDIGEVDTMGVKPTDPMCKKIQQQQTQSQGSPRLSAAPGSMIALRYEENGHVTLPQNQPGKPSNRGTVYVYGTTQPKTNENFLDVFGKWNAEGTGGDKRGRLLATQPYDDGHCYQVNSGEISQQRQKQFPHEASPLMGGDLWCQNDIKIPSDVPTGKPYTIYWVWDWPTEPNKDPNIPKGKAEIYTTCMDIDIKAAGQARNLNGARNLEARDMNMNDAAIPSYMSQLLASSAPAAAAPTPPSAQSRPDGAPHRAAVAAPAVSSAPQQSSAAASAPVSSAPQPSSAAIDSVYIVEAASILKEDIVSELASMITAAGTPYAGVGSAVTVTVTQPAKPTTVYVTAPSVTAPVVSSAPSPSYSSSGGSSSSSSSVVMPPVSLDIRPPIGIFTGTATPVNIPVSTPTTTTAPTLSAAASASTTYVAQRSCAKCKRMGRSRIFGRAT